MKIKIINGDITKETTDIIVNAANEALIPGGGVDAAITKVAGVAALNDRMNLGRCGTGKAMIASAGNLSAKYIIYAVGPRYSEGRDESLASAYRESMEIFLGHKLNSISFPAISAGVYGYPADVAAKIAIDTILEFMDADVEVHFVLFTDEVYESFAHYLKTEKQKYLKNMSEIKKLT